MARKIDTCGSPEANPVSSYGMADRLANKAGNDTDLLCYAAIGHILTRGDPDNRAARRLLETKHPYAGYVAIMFYAFERGEVRKVAKKYLNKLWSKVDQKTWKKRLAYGDSMVWREILIGYSLGKRNLYKTFHDIKTFRDIVNILDDEKTFESSYFKNLPMPRQCLLTEAKFYDAMLALAHDDPEQMQQTLNNVVNIGYHSYYEYKIAKYLLLH